MLVELANFTWAALAGGAMYDGVKMILGKSCDRLQGFVSNDDRVNFETTLAIILEANEDIKNKLENLKNETEITSSFKKVQDSEIDISGNRKKVDDSFHDINNSKITL